MRRPVFLCGALVFLSACGDPLAGVTRISDVELVTSEPAPQALPTEEEIAREGFFNTSAAEPEVAPETVVVPASGPVTALPPRQGGGFFAALRRIVPAARQPVSAEEFAALKASENLPAPSAPVTSAPVTSEAVVSVPVPEAEEQQAEQIAAQVAVASLSADTDAPAVAVSAEPAKRPGFFSRLTASRAAPSKRAAAPKGVEAAEVAYGAELPYGVIAKVCTARRAPLGRKVETNVASGYKLWDSDPGKTSPRTFYVTGFGDGCPRQFTAAHALFGEPAFYEQLHYGPTGKHLKFGATDAAYEKVKSRVCGVRRGKPCGSKMRQLERQTVFINSYARSDDNTRWSELLLHDDVVVASALKGGS